MLTLAGNWSIVQPFQPFLYPLEDILFPPEIADSTEINTIHLCFHMTIFARHLARIDQCFVVRNLSVYHGTFPFLQTKSATMAKFH